jgi:SagB-type dehydrogenase family enzyme
MTKIPGKQDNPSDLNVVYEYHERTKHQLQHYARSLGYMDWASQPNPFRHYEESTIFPFDLPLITATPTYDSLFYIQQQPAAPLNRDSIKRLFYESLAISAWKQAGNSRWSLRVNPSSGDLHPTEAYLIAGPVAGLTEKPGVYHYSAYRHALERRLVLTNDEWNFISHNLPPGSLLIALSSIYWRESWKYGERAFRYCHHDVGHAIGTVTFAALALGWKTRLLHSVTDDDMEKLLGIDQQEGSEAEHADCLLLIFPANKNVTAEEITGGLPASLLERIEPGDFEGRPNSLSNYHHDWPVIDTVAGACRFIEHYPFNKNLSIKVNNKHKLTSDRHISARKIIRQRRSAIAMDGHSSISKETFYRMMVHVSPHPKNNILEVLPWQPRVSLALFIHRVDDLPTGLYLLVRDPDHESSLRSALRSDFRWEKPEGCPDFLHLYLLQHANARDAARTISCHQNIAADGVFTLGMLAEFAASLEHYGASFYPRLFWETGLIGQILYLEAEAAGIRSTGIGCFFDDAMHEVLGISDHSWQSLYHFTVGGPVDDARLQTLPAYWYLK